MDVKDYSQKVDQARDQYRQAQESLRKSYDKDLGEVKETNDNKIKKLSKSYDNQKTKLEEDNRINNENYSNKTKEAIADRAARFRHDIGKNSDKFDQDRNEMRAGFSEKLADLSDSYKKSTEENDRYHDQALKTMNDRYLHANKNYKDDFDQKIEFMTDKNKENLTAQKETTHKNQIAQDKGYHDELENIRSNNQEEKFKEVSRLRNDNQNLRTNFEQERNSMREEKEARIDEMLKAKAKESGDSQKVFAELQDNIRDKNLKNEERVRQDHLAESKGLEKKFNEDLRNVQHMTNQKIKGGNEVSTLKDENKQLIHSYENRLASAREDAKKDQEIATEKEERVDEGYREKLKNLKLAGVEELDKRDSQMAVQSNRSLQEYKDKTGTVLERYKNEVARAKSDGDDSLLKSETNSKQHMKDQRVEFGKYINNVNEKNLDEISSIKSEFAKDKTNFIEKTRKDVSDERNAMKEGYVHQVSVKEDMYEKKLAEMEKQTNKIIENYETRMNNLARKSEKEVEVMRNTNEARRIKEGQTVQIAFENQARQNEIEMGSLRTKYENMIGKDRAVNELRTNQLIQKYEDRLEMERSDHQKEMGLKLSESQAQFERLFKSSELEKETLRNQYEQRMENMKNASLVQGGPKGNSKKA